MNPQILQRIKLASPDPTVISIDLGLGSYIFEDGEFEGYRIKDFEKRTKFEGYLIARVIVSNEYYDENVGYYIDPSADGHYDVQELYFSEEHDKLVLYTYSVYANTNIYNAQLYHVKDIRNLISKYPQLAKEIGLPTSLKPDYIDLDEAIGGEI